MAGTAVAESVPAPVQRRGERRKRASTRWGPDDADVEPVAPDAAEPAVTVPGEQPAPASAAEARPRKRPKRTRWVADDAPDAEVGGLAGHAESACLRCVPAVVPVAGGPCESASAVPAVSRRRSGRAVAQVRPAAAKLVCHDSFMEWHALTGCAPAHRLPARMMACLAAQPRASLRCAHLPGSWLCELLLHPPPMSVAA